MEAPWVFFRTPASNFLTQQDWINHAATRTHEHEQFHFKPIYPDQMFLNSSNSSTSSNPDTENHSVQWPRKCSICPTFLANQEDLYHHFQLTHDKGSTTDGEMDESYPEACALSVVSDSTYENDAAYKYMNEDGYNDLWSDAPSETGIAMANICSVCSFFAESEASLKEHFQFLPCENASDTSEEVYRDEAMGDCMSEENEQQEESDAETVIQGVSTCVVQANQKSSDTQEAVQSWLGHLNPQAELVRQEQVNSVQMQFFREVESVEMDYTCGYCDTDYISLEDLTLHLESHHPQSIDSNKSAIEKAGPASEMQDQGLRRCLDAFKYVLRDMTPEIPVGESANIQVEGDGETPFSSYEEEFVCDFCLAGFEENGELMNHMNQIHSLDV